GCWLRGHEAGGPVTEFTALVLIRAARGGPFVAEALGERAMAAALAVGADGVVLGAHLWGTRDAPIAAAHRDAILGATSGRDTAVLGDAVDHPVRVLARGAPEARRALIAAEALPERFAAVVAEALE